MKNSFFILSLTFFALMLYGCGTTTAKTVPANGWEKLGTKKVNYALDRDVIFVGAREGRFSKLKLEVTGGSIRMHKIVVEYKNGQKETIEVRHLFKRGSGSRVIDLKGNKRFIKDITFWYDTRNISRKKATLHVYGKH